MKGKIRIIVITMLVLLVGTGVFFWKMNDISQKLQQKEAETLKEERDLLEDQDGKVIDTVKEIDIIPLSISGDDKNVVTTSFHNTAEIYSTEKSAEVEENLTNIKENRVFTFDDPLWAYNPYGTNSSAMYAYFTTTGNCYCKYTISVADESIPDFTRTAIAGTGKNVTKEHEYQILGLVAGKTNYITLRLYNADDELSETNTFSIEIPSSPSGASVTLSTTDGRSESVISNGLYVVFSAGKKKKQEKAILLYDNSGVLRGEIPTNGYCGRKMEQVYDTIVYATARNKISRVNALGQVTNTYSVSGYRQDGEFTYDGYGNLYVIAAKTGKKATPKSKVLKIELESGEVTEALDMDTLLPSVYKKAVKRSKKANTNWVGLTSIQVVGTNKLLVSCKQLSSIIKVSNVGSLLPKVNYIIADKELYDSYKTLKKKVLTKSTGEDGATAAPEETSFNILRETVTPEAFTSQYGQETISYQETSTEGQYELTLLNNNYGSKKKSNGESYYYTYLVDETTSTYQLKEKTALDQTKKDGNIAVQEDTFVYCCSDAKWFVENDSAGTLIKQFAFPVRAYRVYKYDFKDFWFY